MADNLEVTAHVIAILAEIISVAASLSCAADGMLFQREELATSPSFVQYAAFQRLIVQLLVRAPQEGPDETDVVSLLRCFAACVSLCVCS